MNKLFFERALDLARKGGGFTSPNPCVGAVIVKGGTIVAEGWHKKAGCDHAEMVAMKNLMRKSGVKTMDFDPNLFRNAEMYVTLEPCCHTGQTAPCCEAIVNAGFQKVFIGMKDPNIKVNGKGIDYLKKNGVKVEVLSPTTELAQRIISINQPFIKYIKTGVPYITMKAGISLDGKVALQTGESKWITSEKSRVDARNERSMCDAVMVGVGTIFADDPMLAPSGKFRNKNLLRIVVDPNLKLSLRHKVFRDGNVLVFCTSGVPKKTLKKFQNAGIEVKIFNSKMISVRSCMKFLAKRGIQSVFMEGGAGAHGYTYDSFLKNRDLIDRVLFYISPKIIGGDKSLSVVGGSGITKLSKAPEFNFLNWKKVGNDMKFEGFYNLY